MSGPAHLGCPPHTLTHSTCLPFINPPLVCAFPFVSSRPGPSLCVPPLNDRLRPLRHRRDRCEGTDGGRDGTATDTVARRRCRKMERARGFVGNWETLDLLRAKFRSQILHHPRVWQKKRSLKNYKQYRDGRTASRPPRGACERISISAEGQGDALLYRIDSDI